MVDDVSDNFPSNVIPLLVTSVIVPFASITCTPANGVEAGAGPVSPREQFAEELRQAMAHLEQDPETTVASAERGKIIPFPGPTPPDWKIVTIDFGSASAPRPDLSEGVRSATQLPATASVRENTAADQRTNSAGDALEPGRSNLPKSMLSGAFTVRQDQQRGDWRTRGIGAARESIRMESPASHEQPNSAGQDPEDSASDAMPAPPGPKLAEIRLTDRTATEWQAGPPGDVLDRAAPDLSKRDADSTGTVERMKKMITREVALVRQHGSDSMAVVLRPDENTELFLHLSRRNGQIEANIRCERGDFSHLNSLWSQLRDSLAQQKVRLAPLQGAASGTQNFRNPGGSQQPNGGGDSSTHQQRSGQESMDEWPAPASPDNSPAHVRSRRGSRHRLTTSRPGWETWA